MFGSIGITEMMIFAGITLVILGPDKFPEFAKIVARTVKDVRGYVSEAQREIAKELSPVKKELEKLKKIDPEEYIDKLTGGALKDTGMTDPAEDDYGDPNPEPDYSVDPYSQDGTYEYDAFSKDSSSESSAPEVENPEEEVAEASTPEPKAKAEAGPASPNGASETADADEADVSPDRLDG